MFTDSLTGTEPVLYRENQRVVAHQAARSARSRGNAGRLGGDDDEVAGLQLGGIRDRAQIAHDPVAARTLDVQPCFANRTYVRFPDIYNRYVIARIGQQASVDRPHGAGADDCNSQNAITSRTLRRRS